MFHGIIFHNADVKPNTQLLFFQLIINQTDENPVEQKTQFRIPNACFDIQNKSLYILTSVFLSKHYSSFS